jgi:hypothetical protein
VGGNGERETAIVFIHTLRKVLFITNPNMSRSPIGISVARIVLQGGVASPTPSPPPFATGLGTVLGGVKPLHILGMYCF